MAKKDLDWANIGFAYRQIKDLSQTMQMEHGMKVLLWMMQM